MPIFTGCSVRARIRTGAQTALAVHAKPALRTARRPTRRACHDAAFRVLGYKLAAPNQPGQTLVAMAYVGKTRDGVVPTVITPRRTSLDLKAAEDARRSRKSPANLETEEMTSIRADFLVADAVL
jgi:hypothetical protein